MTGTPPTRGHVNPFDVSTSGGSSTDSAYIDVTDAPWNWVAGGVVDNAVGIQAAFDYASTNHVRVRIPAGIYGTTVEPQLDGDPIIIEGEPHKFWSDATSGTVIKAIGSIRSGLALLSPRHQIHNVVVHGNDLASYGFYFSEAGTSVLDNCYAHHALIDGYYNTGGAVNNNHIELRRCWAADNGKTHATANLLTAFTNGNGRQVLIAGTVATSAAGFDIVFTGAPDMTTLGIRKGDLIAIGGTTKLTAAYYLIESVLNATTVRLQVNINNRPLATASGLDYAIGIGDGWRDNRNANGGVGVFANCIFFRNGGSGIRMDCAYGHSIRGGDQSYNNFAGVNFGVSDNSGAISGAHMTNVYCEGTAMVYFLGGGKIVIESPEGVTDDTATQFFVYANDAIAEATIIRGDRITSWRFGDEQNFIVQIRNNGGTIEHRTIADVDTGGATDLADRITGKTNAYTATPSVNSGVAFAAGGGILSTSTAVFLLNTAREQNSGTPFRAFREFNDTGTDYMMTAGTVSTSINGVTRRWPSIRLRNPLTGAQVAWATALATPGTSLAFRVSGKFR